jgi:GntR family transcriptional regulator, transcriptional repressor for pyruvate dehydrogenase complex
MSDMVSNEHGLADDDIGEDADTGTWCCRNTLATIVYKGLLKDIADGIFLPDQRLPGENTMAQHFGVSRPVVREALGRLREEGIVYSRRGAGSFVKNLPPGTASPPPGAQTCLPNYPAIQTIADIQRSYEFRLAIEPECAYYAARRRDEDTLLGLKGELGLMHEAMRANKPCDEADFAFHSWIAEASNNHYFEVSIAALKDHINAGMNLTPCGGPPSPLILERAFDEHRRLFEAIRDRDGERARAEMRQHVQSAFERVFGGRTLDLSL